MLGRNQSWLCTQDRSRKGLGDNTGSTRKASELATVLWLFLALLREGSTIPTPALSGASRARPGPCPGAYPPGLCPRCYDAPQVWLHPLQCLGTSWGGQRTKWHEGLDSLAHVQPGTRAAQALPLLCWLRATKCQGLNPRRPWTRQVSALHLIQVSNQKPQALTTIIALQ